MRSTNEGHIFSARASGAGADCRNCVWVFMLSVAWSEVFLGSAQDGRERSVDGSVCQFCNWTRLYAFGPTRSLYMIASYMNIILSSLTHNIILFEIIMWWT